MEAKDVVELAKKYAHNESSVVCLRDAEACLEKGECFYAKQRALKSLAYSVGVFHPDYQKAVA